MIFHQELDKPIICPCCKKQLDGATNMTDGISKPTSGDVTICWDCGSVCIFNEDLSVHLMGPEDISSWSEQAREHLVKSLMMYRLAKADKMVQDMGYN